MTVKELISKCLKELNHVRIYMRGAVDDKLQSQIEQLRKFLYGIENFELPLHKKVFKNTLYISVIIACSLLMLGTIIYPTLFVLLGPPIVTYFAINMFILGVFATTFVGLLFGCIGIFLAPKIIPIWNDDDIKQQCTELKSFTIPNKCYTDEMNQILNHTSNIIYTLEQKEYNISDLLLKDEKELSEFTVEGVVVNEDKDEHKNKLTKPQEMIHSKRKASNSDGIRNDNIFEDRPKRSKIARYPYI